VEEEEEEEEEHGEDEEEEGDNMRVEVKEVEYLRRSSACPQ